MASRNMNQNVDEHRWIITIRRAFEEEEEYEEEEDDIPVNIFSVPKPLMVSALDCYVPQQIAIGPYHHWRPELYEMERYKLASAKRFQKQIMQGGGVKFENIVDHFTRFEPRIRACYHKYLNLDGETLGWMMAMDACFLLQFLRIYAAANKEGKLLVRLSSRMSHLVDVAGRKSAHNAIIRDMVMLENQIPLFLLRKVLELEFSSLEVADDVLMSMLLGFCKEFLPFKISMEEDTRSTLANVHNFAHLLDFLYLMILPKLEDTPPAEIAEIDDREGESTKQGDDQENHFSGKYGSLKKFGILVWKILKKLINKAPVLIKRVLFSKPTKDILKFPWKIISNIPVFKFLIPPIENLFLNSDKKEDDQNPAKTENSSTTKSPLVEQIAIPSVIKLAKAGVQFVASKSGILGISFDDKTATFYLPRISLDVNSEVILRNLVAYETCNASGPLVFTRYTELMNGIIDTEEDAKVLREKGIIQNHLKSDGEVAKMCNGMSKCVKLTKVPFLDKAIEDVNRYYNGRWNVKIGKFFKVYVFGSWRILTLIAALVLLLMTMLQSFCSVYNCVRIFHLKQAE